jgi:hypothetical protein
MVAGKGNGILKGFIFGFVLMVITSCNPANSGKTVWENQNGFYRTTFNDLTFVVDANLSGRITSFQYNSSEILGQPDLHPDMFGSTFWPAPQSKWGWPPYPVLDVEPYSAKVSEDTLAMVSQKCPQSGLQFVKKFIPEPAKNRVRIEYVIRNISDSTIAVAPWEVTRVPAFGWAFFPIGESAPLEKSNLQNVEIENGMVWYYGNTDSFSRGQKMFVSAKEGWLVYCKNNLLFIKVFPDIGEGECAPGQGEIEVYASGDNHYIELENHGKLESLQPGQEIFYPVYWLLTEIPEKMKSDGKNAEWVKEVRKVIGGDF